MNTFSFSRFIKFFSNDWKMNAKQYGLLFGAMALYAILFCIFVRDDKYGIAIDVWMYWSVYMIFLAVQGFNISIQLHAFTSKTKKTALFLQPVSKTEFLMAKMLNCFVLFPLFYLAFCAIIAFLISRYNIAYYDILEKGARTMQSIKYWKNTASVAVRIWPCITAIYWTGAFYYGKYSAVKSLITVGVLYSLLMGFSYLLIGLYSGYWKVMCLPLFGYYDHHNSLFWSVFEVWPGFIEATLLSGSVIWVAISVVRFKEITV
ncbi:MAG: hypothetical protein LBC84_04485 [Prevotellaceae bacterium]|jgi:hypothetical protein|nr:hypothetical protein [Prevotellaceae bacterium]